MVDTGKLQHVASKSVRITAGLPHGSGVLIDGGVLGLGWGIAFSDNDWSVITWRVPPDMRFLRGWWFHAQYGYWWGFVQVPMWCIVLFVALPTAWLWWRDYRDKGPGNCKRCGYDLRGLAAGARCPEYGKGST